MQTSEMVLRILLVGVGATLIMDAGALIRARVFGIPSLDYGLVGRWLGLMRQGQFQHASIVAAPRVRHERLIGWIFHYLTGNVFALLLVVLTGVEWLFHPTLMPALAAGLISMAAPFFILQPAFGFGIAASKTAAPYVARRRTLITHLTFGLGLYVAGWLVLLLYPTPHA